MIDFQTAKDMAQTFLDEDMHHEGDRFVIIDEKVYERRDAWYFPYQSEQYLKTGSRALYVSEGICIAVRKDGGKNAPRR